MLTVIGTVPCDDFPIVNCPAVLDGGYLILRDRRVPVNRGTPALLAAAAKTAQAMGCGAPNAWLVGDTGLGKGSRALYACLADELSNDTSDVLVFHYLQPDVDWHNRVLLAVQQRNPRPTLIADAGFMYAAKMSGQAGEYDLFTPDVGELAFLADETAPHPFYTRGFILQEENKASEFIERAYIHDNAARHLLVKGRIDLMANRDGIIASIEEPLCPAMEAIGGTGDTLTGIVAGLVEAGFDMVRAAEIAARANRLAGMHANPSPASQILEIIGHIPVALKEALRQEKN